MSKAGPILAQHGLRFIRIREYAPWQRVAKVETPQDFLAQFVPVLMEGFGVRVDGTGPSKVWEPLVNAYILASFIDHPTVHHYLGWEGDKPVVPGTLVYEAGVAGIYIVATKPAYRGKGYGRTTPSHAEGHRGWIPHYSAAV